MVTGPRLEMIDEAYLDALISSEVREGKQIEYKITWPGDTADAKKEFLADVTSFANTIGGDLLIGISETDGIPEDIVGVPNENIDANILRVENLIRDGIEPRIVGIDINTIELESGNVVMLIRIPNSWIAPHMITYSAYSRFYARNSAGKYILDHYCPNVGF